MSRCPSSAARRAGRLAAWLLVTAIAAPVGAQTLGSLPIDIRGASRLEYDETTGILVANGAPVVVTRASTVLRAPRIRYDARARVVTATGGVIMEEPGLTVHGDRAELRLTEERIRVSGGVTVRSTREGRPVELSAPDVEGSLQTRRFSATGGVTVTRGEWVVTGRRIDYEDRPQVAVVSGEPTARFRDATMTAQAMTFYVADERMRGDGDVRLRRGDLTGQAPRAEVFGKENRAVLSGGARVDRGPDRVTAEEIEMDLEGTRVVARGGSRLVITPP
ncbi:MAG: LptA/OstA family protein [Armatimonadota bacterium]|nr:LptA/OstA family protein [Armatimonadota bacterium]